ncbi:ACP S-malonyltransferase [Paenibacillus tengchongensis]|uniref:ACP S-malonyltransferase n=1 Tax=Paenibacillus tengchongensis TaxID=2608684 RepID=UPI00124CEA55|nr:ACP S-malonyltransferase [Paenibacillus tengchongensis]
MSKYALLFPGQGSQYIGMAKKWYTGYSAAKRVFEEADDLLGYGLSQLCFEGNIGELTKTLYAQPAIFTSSIAAFHVYMEEIGVEPVCSAGHSLGEISALVCSGAVSFPAGLKLVQNRATFMQEAADATQGSMLAITDLPAKVVEETCAAINPSVVVSNYNSHDQTVISGNEEDIKKIGELFEQMGATVIPLKVGAPFHSPYMKPASIKFLRALEQIEYLKLKWPVISNVTGLPYEESKIAQYLSAQMLEPVRWQQSMAYIAGQDVEYAIEIGPKNVLTKLMTKNQPLVKAYSFDIENDYLDLKRVSAPSVSAFNTIGVIIKCLAVAVSTKNNNWSNNEYEQGVIVPYKKIQLQLEELEKKGNQPSLDECISALRLLKQIFDTKGTSIVEQEERYIQIFEETGTYELLHNACSELGFFKRK